MYCLKVLPACMYVVSQIKIPYLSVRKAVLCCTRVSVEILLPFRNQNFPNFRSPLAIAECYRLPIPHLCTLYSASLTMNISQALAAMSLCMAW